MKFREKQVQLIWGFFYPRDHHCKSYNSQCGVFHHPHQQNTGVNFLYEAFSLVIEDTTNHVSSDLHDLLLPWAGCLTGR